MQFTQKCFLGKKKTKSQAREEKENQAEDTKVQETNKNHKKKDRGTKLRTINGRVGDETRLIDMRGR